MTLLSRPGQGGRHDEAVSAASLALVSLPVTDPDRLRPGLLGVWFPDDPRQVPWQRFLDEVSGAGYEWIELGPYGYLPTDPAVLTEETARRGLRVSAGTVFTGLHHGPDVWDRTWAHVAENAALAQAVGAGHLVVIPSFWRDDRTGEVLEDRTLTAGQWRDLTRLTERLGREVRERHGLRLVVHPHADTHLDGEESVTRFLDATDPEAVSLCLDTGHYAYMRRGQRQADRDVRRADRLPAPQAGRPGDPGRGGGR